MSLLAVLSCEGTDKEKKSARVIVSLTSQEYGQATLAGAGDGGAAQGQEAPAGCGRPAHTQHSVWCTVDSGLVPGTW